MTCQTAFANTPSRCHQQGTEIKQKTQSGPLLNGIWDNLKKKSYTTGSKIPLGATLIIMQANEGHGLYPCSGTASSPLLSSTCHTCLVCSTLSVLSPLFLVFTGFIFCTKLWSVNKNPGSVDQELDCRDAAFPDKHRGEIHQIQEVPSLCFAWQPCWQWQTIHRGLVPWNVTSCAIWDGIRTQGTCTELLEGAREAPYFSTKVAGGQGK